MFSAVSDLSVEQQHHFLLCHNLGDTQNLMQIFLYIFLSSPSDFTHFSLFLGYTLGSA